ACPLSSPLLAVATRISGHLCDGVVVSNGALLDVLARAGVPRRRLQLIPIGTPRPDVVMDRAAARQRLGIAPDAFAVGAVGRLVPDKGLDALVQALGELPDPRRHLRLVVAGSGSMRGALEALAVERLQERAVFLGFVQNPGLVYAAIDLLVIPSRVEGVPLVLHEAASYGVPVVASDLPGIRAATIEGATALLFPAGDIGALARAIQRVR